MKIELIFDHWGDPKRDDLADYHPWMGDFHGGTMFEGTIELNAEQTADFERSMKRGYRPYFWVYVKKGVTGS